MKTSLKTSFIHHISWKEVTKNGMKIVLILGLTGWIYLFYDLIKSYLNKDKPAEAVSQSTSNTPVNLPKGVKVEKKGGDTYYILNCSDQPSKKITTETEIIFDGKKIEVNKK